MKSKSMSICENTALERYIAYNRTHPGGSADMLVRFSTRGDDGASGTLWPAYNLSPRKFQGFRQLIGAMNAVMDEIGGPASSEKVPLYWMKVAPASQNASVLAMR